MSQGRHAWGAVILLALATVACQWVSDLIPTQATPSPSPSASPTPVTPLTIPVVLPSASPTPTPAPTPGPSPTPSQGTCTLPASNPSSYACFAEQIRFLGELDAAITAVTQQHPELFDLGRQNCEGCYYVKDVDQYHVEVMRQLGLRGLCSHYDGDEIAIKNTNSFNEQYDIILAAGYIRRGQGTYMGTCRPAWF
jgi:hypothetical protein